MPQEVIEVTEREVEIIEVIERGPVGPTGPQPDINYEVVSSARTLEAADLIAADTSGGAFTLTLPANPSNGDAVDIFDFSETFDTNPLTIARNGQPIESLNEDLVANVEGAYFTLIYTGVTRGWQVLPRYGTSGGGGESALTTQGDMLYRGVGINTRLPIGSAGQILKVNSGATAPEWGEAPATGVTSVGVSGSDGIEVDSGSPVTGSGTIALGVNAASLRSHINVADGANNYTHPNHSGEVTSSGDGATTIANDAVTNAKLANVATATIKGRATAGTGDPEDLSATQVRTILNVADGAEVNVQSNWTEADSGSDAFILNKPSIPTASSATPQSLGVAAAGTSVDFARADHVHAMPSAADVGAAPATGIDPTAITGTAVVDSDARLSDSRTPSSHASSHAAAGSDPLFDQNLNTTDSVAFANLQITDGLANFNGIGFEDELRIALEERAFDGDWLINSLSFTDAAATRTNLGLGDAATADIGTGAGDVCAGDDARLSDARTPTSHTHGNLTNDGKIGTTAGLPLKTGTAGVVEAGAFGTGAGEFAEGNHTHADLHTRSHAITSTSDHTAGNHKVFYSDGSGQIQELALGNSGEVLTSNGASAAPSFAAASGGDTVSIDASAADVLTATSGAISADDGGTIDDSDPFIKWDDTAGKLVYANPLSRPSAGAFYVGLAPTTTALGSNAINIQAARTSGNQVAGGQNSVVVGNQLRCEGSASIGIGFGGSSQNNANCVGIGATHSCFAAGATAIGNGATANSVNSTAIGDSALATGRGAFATRPFASVYWGGQTTNDTPLILNLDATATNRMTIAANTALAVDILLVARRSDTADKWLVARRFLGIRRDGSNNTSLIGSVQTLGTDQTDGSPTWSFTLTADDTNEALQLEVTGAASETVQWRATAFYRVV